jgi:hypothetical protein
VGGAQSCSVRGGGERFPIAPAGNRIPDVQFVANPFTEVTGIVPKSDRESKFCLN